MPDHPSIIRWDAENVIKVGLKINRNQGPELFTLFAKAENKAVDLNCSSPFISVYQKADTQTGFAVPWEPEGTRYTKELPPSSWRQSTAHRAVELKYSSPFFPV